MRAVDRRSFSSDYVRDRHSSIEPEGNRCQIIPFEPIFPPERFDRG